MYSLVIISHQIWTDMNSIDNILSILTTTGTPTETKNTATPTQTRIVTPKVESKTTTTPAHLLNPSKFTNFKSHFVN